MHLRLAVAGDAGARDAGAGRGAARRLREAGSSLLPVGVVDVFGQFSRGEMVACEDRHGERVACGLVNYDAADARRVSRGRWRAPG